MRRLLFIFFALVAGFEPSFGNSTKVFYNSIVANSFQLFEENGKIGVKNDQGQVVIPAQHEAIGWSNGDFSIVNNVTGYRNKGMWGLINLQNSKITKAEFVDLSPGDATLIVARKKLPGLVKIQAGCINSAGKEVIPFVYDGMRIVSFRAIVYIRNGTQFKHGLIDLNNKLLIPIEYRNIYALGSLRFGVEDFNNKTAIFSESGLQLIDFRIDSLSSFKKDYAIIYQDEGQGLIDRQGQLKLESSYREIKIADDGTISVRPSDSWLFLDGENKLIQKIQADSIQILDNNLFQVKNGNGFRLLDKNLKPLNQQLFSNVGAFKNGKAIFQKGPYKGIMNRKGEIKIAATFLDLIVDGKFIRAKQRSENQIAWNLLDSMGTKLTPKQYDFIGSFNGNYFPVRNRNYWGAIDASGKEIIACVHDSIGQHSGTLTVVRFRGNYGIINLREEWIITPQPHELEILNDDRLFVLTPKTKFFKSLKGDLIYFSDNTLEFKKDHLLEYLPSGATWKIDLDGLIVDRLIKPNDVQKIAIESEGLRAVQKDGRYGFIDSRGRLRIANRYENARDFNEQLAAIKIRGKWGFINHDDQIAVQPVYDEVAPFTNGFSVVTQKKLVGLIRPTGKLLLPVRYEQIIVLNDNRFLIQQNSLWGLADRNGAIIINPKFDSLKDLNNGYIIASRNGKFGLLTTEGLSTIPEMYDGLMYDDIHKQYIAVKRATWELVKF